MANNDNAFLGRGWSFPPSFDKNVKEVDMTEDEEDIENSLRILLSTTLGERVMQPKFGCNMNDMVFESIDTSLQTEMRNRIQNSILYFESRINVQAITISTQNELDGLVLISLDYIIRSTNARTNLVYPFYISEGNK